MIFNLLKPTLCHCHLLIECKNKVPTKHLQLMHLVKIHDRQLRLCFPLELKRSYHKQSIPLADIYAQLKFVTPAYHELSKKMILVLQTIQNQM